MGTLDNTMYTKFVGDDILVVQIAHITFLCV